MEKKKRILLIDHTSIHSLLLHSILIDEGYNCNLACGKEEALALLGKSYYELILMDVTFAEIEGLELLKEIKENAEYGTIPVIAMSVKSDEKNIREALKNGAEDYLFKPFNIQDLINKIIQNFKLTNQRR